MQFHKSTITTIPNNKHKNITHRTATAPQPRSHHSSTTQACAACKYQRRKCASDCILAPYFPHDRQLQFLNAHRLFGVSNIIKIVGTLKQPEKDQAMRTIIFQSDVRAADPVGGCYRIICDLERRINLAKAELEIVLHQLALCRAAEQKVVVVQPPSAAEGVDSYDDEKWRGQYVAEEDLNSWGCMGTVDVHAYAESTSSPFPHHDHHGRKFSMDECNNDMIRPILDHLVCDDIGAEEEFEFDSNGNIIPKNSTISKEAKGAMKDEDDSFSYAQDQDDLKTAANFFTLTNCDL